MTQIYRDDRWVARTLRVVPVFAAIAFVATVALLLRYTLTANVTPTTEGWFLKGDAGLVQLLLGCWIFWVTAPPAWFAFEYFYLYDREEAKSQFDQCKYGQEIVARAWATLVVVLGVFLYKSFT